MELRDLRTFAAVARLLSFHRAAAELNAAQSTVSARIAALETELGVRLFERLGRRVALTDAGERLVQYAAKLIDVEDEARAWVTGESRLRGLLTVRVPESLCAYRLPPVIAAFRRRHPEVALHLTACTLNGLEKDLRQGITDLAFVMTDSVRGGDLLVEALGVEPLVLVAAPHHPLASREKLAARDLHGATLVLSTADCAYRAAIEDSLAAEGVQLAAGLEFSSAAALRGCVASGVGVTLLPGAAVRDELRAGTLRALAWTDQPFETAVLMVRHKGKWVSPYMDTFMELCRAAYAESDGSSAGPGGTWDFPCPMADVATIIVPAKAARGAAPAACCAGDAERPATPAGTGTFPADTEADGGTLGEPDLMTGPATGLVTGLATGLATGLMLEAAATLEVQPFPLADAAPTTGDKGYAPADEEPAVAEDHAGHDAAGAIDTEARDDAWDYPDPSYSDADGLAGFPGPDADMMAVSPDTAALAHDYEDSFLEPETVWGNPMDMAPALETGMPHAGPDDATDSALHDAPDGMDGGMGDVDNAAYDMPPYPHADPVFDAWPHEASEAAPESEAGLEAKPFDPLPDPAAAPHVAAPLPGLAPTPQTLHADATPMTAQEDTEPEPVAPPPHGREISLAPATPAEARQPSLWDAPSQEPDEPEPAAPVPTVPTVPTFFGAPTEDIPADAPEGATEVVLEQALQPGPAPASSPARPAAPERTPEPAPESAQWLSLLPPKR